MALIHCVRLLVPISSEKRWRWLRCNSAPRSKQDAGKLAEQGIEQIIHAVVSTEPGGERTLPVVRRALSAALELAYRDRIHSVAVPLMTGNQSDSPEQTSYLDHGCYRRGRFPREARPSSARSDRHGLTISRRYRHLERSARRSPQCSLARMIDRNAPWPKEQAGPPTGNRPQRWRLSDHMWKFPESSHQVLSISCFASDPRNRCRTL